MNRNEDEMTATIKTATSEFTLVNTTHEAVRMIEEEFKEYEIGEYQISYKYKKSTAEDSGLKKD